MWTTRPAIFMPVTRYIVNWLSHILRLGVGLVIKKSSTSCIFTLRQSGQRPWDTPDTPLPSLTPKSLPHSQQTLDEGRHYPDLDLLGFLNDAILIWLTRMILLHWALHTIRWVRVVHHSIVLWWVLLSHSRYPHPTTVRRFPLLLWVSMCQYS